MDQLHIFVIFEHICQTMVIDFWFYLSGAVARIANARRQIDIHIAINDYSILKENGMFNYFQGQHS